MDFLLDINPNNFPSKLWRLVNDPQIRSIYWDDNGEGIFINQQFFETEVLFSHSREINEYFKTTDFTSFVRQLNLYGFRKVRTTHGFSENQLHNSSFIIPPHHFQNPNFKQGKLDLLLKLKRLTAVNKAKLAAGMPLASRSSKRFHHVRLNLPKDNSGSVSTQGTPYNYPGDDPQQKDRMPISSQEFVIGHGDALFTTHKVPFSAIQCFLMTSENEHPYCTSPMQQGLMHHESWHYTPDYHNQVFLDSKVQVSQNPTASYYDNSDSVGSDYPVEAGDGPEPRKSERTVNLDIVFKLADEIQAVAAGVNLAEVINPQENLSSDDGK